jgi:hypothetical protein
VTHWTGRLVTTAAVWAVVVVAPFALQSRPRPELLALVVVAAAAVVFLLLDVSADFEPVRWPTPVAAPVSTPGEDQRLARLRRLVAQHLEAHEVGDALHRQLTELADRALLARHGVTRRSEPERAAALLGPELSRVVDTHPPYPRLTLDQIDLLVSRIEEL